MFKKILYISIVAALLLSTSFSGVANATYLGGKFPHTKKSVTTLYYKYNNPHRYNGNVWQGAANWRSAAARVKPTQDTSSIKILIRDNDTDQNYYGVTWIEPCASCSTYTSTGFLDE